VATIRDVAVRAGTSKSAVSRVLNEQPGVAPAIRGRVLAAIEELGYRPNQQARSLRTSRTHVLGLLLPTLALPVIPQILQGTATAAHNLGYLLAISDAHDDADLWEAYVEELVARRVDGILCYDSGDIDAMLAPALEAGVPTMLLNRASHPVAATLSFESREPFAEAVGHLVQVGHRRVGMIVSRAREGLVEWARDDLEGHELTLGREYVRRADDPAAARSAASDLLGVSERPTAIIVQGAYSASAAAAQIRSLGLSIPDDCSLISIGESDWTMHADPPVNVIHLPFREGAASAVELLIRLIEGDESAPRNLAFPADYIRRGSVGPPAGAQ
jgi:LacI family transcriptional regulator